MINHFPKWLPVDDADSLMSVVGKSINGDQQESLLYPFTQRTVVVWEKPHLTPRLTCFFSDDGQGYRYSNQITEAYTFTPLLLGIRAKLEKLSGVRLQACLMNYYRSGQDTVGWHSDSDHIFGDRPTIVSVSCGASRKFRMRNPDKTEVVEFDLGHQDVLIFTDEHVLKWHHCVPRTKKPIGPRLNLTFRSFD